MSNTAPIKWAQRSDSLFITIALPDVKDETITLTDEELHFKGTSEGKPYEVNIKFFKPIDSKAKGSTYKVNPRSVQMHVMKKVEEKEDEDDEVFWPRLLQDKNLEKNQVKIDWDRYVDEDEEEEGFDTTGMDGMMGGAGGPDMGGMDMEAMMKMMGGGGAGGMPGMMGGGGEGGMPDMAALQQMMGDMSPSGADIGADDADSDSDDEDDLPDLE